MKRLSLLIKRKKMILLYIKVQFNLKQIAHCILNTQVDLLRNLIFRCLDYIASPGIIIPLIVLMTLIIYYMSSLAGSLREANNDLKVIRYRVYRIDWQYFVVLTNSCGCISDPTETRTYRGTSQIVQDSREEAECCRYSINEMEKDSASAAASQSGNTSKRGSNSEGRRANRYWKLEWYGGWETTDDRYRTKLVTSWQKSERGRRWYKIERYNFQRKVCL